MQDTVEKCVVCGQAMVKGRAYASRNRTTADGDKFCLCVNCWYAERREENENAERDI